MYCKICNAEIWHFKKHLKMHNISEEAYYNRYIGKYHLCEYCGKPTKFISLKEGYRNTCGYSCAGRLREKNRTVEDIKRSNEKRTQTYIKKYNAEHPMKNIEVQQKQKDTNIERYGVPNVWNGNNPIRDQLENKMIDLYSGVGWGSNKQFKEGMHQRAIDTYTKNIAELEKLYNATSQTHLTKLYGQGFISAKIVPEDVIIYVNNSKLIKNEFIPKIEAYFHRYRYGKTLPEQKIFNSIKEIYDGPIKYGDKKNIYPKEIDIYMSKLKLGIEYNGTHWHSIELDTPIDYHLNKSILCREKGIRLIHIYGFEDLDEQINLILSLIKGIDKYPKNDFNKNNLISEIPEPEIIYNKDYTIYGAGKLY